MLTVIDNYDSFTYNLVQQIERLAGVALRVVRNDAFDPQQLLAEKPCAIVISPGPGTPARAGRIVELIRANESVPLLGVCLGHQAVGEAFGARIVRGGVPGPGEITIASGFSASSASGSNASLRTTRTATPARRSICWTRL